MHSHRYQYRYRVVRDQTGAPPRQLPSRRSSLTAAIALGAALPLVFGAAQSFGVGADAAKAALTTPATDFSKPEEGEDKPGGGATSKASVNNANAFSASSGNMDFKRELDFKIGNAMFRKNWVSAPASTDASDGLGPLFNSRGCQNCHLKDGRGHPPLTEGIPDDSHSMLMRLSVPPRTEEEKRLLASHKLNVIPEPTYGGQLQDLSIQGHKAEGQIKIDYTEIPVKLVGVGFVDGGGLDAGVQRAAGDQGQVKRIDRRPVYCIGLQGRRRNRTVELLLAVGGNQVGVTRAGVEWRHCRDLVHYLCR